MTGWIVVFGAILAELAASIVTNNSPTPVALPVLAAPAAVAVGVGLVQWWQARSARAEPASWWHLLGAAAGVVIWLIFPTYPGVLGGASNAAAACQVLPTTDTAECLARATKAYDGHALAWWLTAAVILVMALLARRSRIAAWAAIPVAFAGCEIASHYLQVLLVQYQAG